MIIKFELLLNFSRIGTAHGFATRPNLALSEIKEAYEGAFEQTVSWFNKTLIV